MGLVQLFRLYKRFLILDIQYCLEYKWSFLDELFFYFLEAFVWVAFWQVIFSHTTSLGGWSLADSFILVGMANIFMGVWATFFLAPSILDHLVKDGVTFERYLVRPVPTFWAIIGDRFQFRRTGEEIIIGILIVILATNFKGYTPPLIALVLSITVMMLSVIILTLLFGVFNSIVFWIPSANVIDILHSLFDFLRFPMDDRLMGRFKHIFILGYPLMLFVTIPTQIYLQMISLLVIINYLIIEVFLLVIWSILFSFVWKKGLSVYQSFGG